MCCVQWRVSLDIGMNIFIKSVKVCGNVDISLSAIVWHVRIYYYVYTPCVCTLSIALSGQRY